MMANIKQNLASIILSLAGAVIVALFGYLYLTQQTFAKDLVEMKARQPTEFPPIHYQNMVKEAFAQVALSFARVDKQITDLSTKFDAQVVRMEGKLDQNAKMLNELTIELRLVPKQKP